MSQVEDIMDGPVEMSQVDTHHDDTVEGQAGMSPVDRELENVRDRHTEVIMDTRGCHGWTESWRTWMDTQRSWTRDVTDGQSWRNLGWTHKGHHGHGMLWMERAGEHHGWTSWMAA